MRTDEASTLSALTVFDGARRLIVHNEQHSAPRQASDICHEQSHGLLLHEPGVAIECLVLFAAWVRILLSLIGVAWWLDG